VGSKRYQADPTASNAWMEVGNPGARRE